VRDNFSLSTLRTLRDRVAGICSRPECRRATIGPTRGLGVLNIGEGAHITAASAEGPRYNPRLTAAQRVDFSNGIWLCRTCHRIVDSDAEAFPVELLHTWKSHAEALARLRIENFSSELTGTSEFLDVRGTKRRGVVNLRFVGVTDVDKRSVSDVVNAKDEVEIRYSDMIEKALRTLQVRDRDPDAHMAQHPRRNEVEPGKRGEIAAHFHSYNKDLLRRASLIAEYNSAGLRRLLETLDELKASATEREDSVSTFGSLAALRMALALKRGYDWDKQEGVRHWFEALQLETTIGPSLLPLVPKLSPTGDATFGCRCWCAARVGSASVYEYVMFPYKVVLPLFLGGVQGNRAAFFQWVLPQIFDSERLGLRGEEDLITVENWEPFLLHGSHLEWWSRHRDSPWGDIYGC